MRVPWVPNGGRFAVLDAVPCPDPAVVVRQRELLAGPAAGHGALYHPRLWVAGAGGASLGVDPGNGVVLLALDAARLGLDLGVVDAMIEAVEAVPPAAVF